MLLPQWLLMLERENFPQLKVLLHGKIKSLDKCGSDQTAKQDSWDSDGKEKLMETKQQLRSNLTLQKIKLQDSSDNHYGSNLEQRLALLTEPQLVCHSTLEKTIQSAQNGICQLLQTLRFLMLIRLTF